MVSLEDSHSISTPFPTTPPSSSSKTQRFMGRSMPTVRSNLYNQSNCYTHSFPGSLPDNKLAAYPSETLTDSLVDFRLSELAAAQLGHHLSPNSPCSDHHSNFLDLSQIFNIPSPQKPRSSSSRSRRPTTASAT